MPPRDPLRTPLAPPSPSRRWRTSRVPSRRGEEGSIKSLHAIIGKSRTLSTRSRARMAALTMNLGKRTLAALPWALELRSRSAARSVTVCPKPAAPGHPSNKTSHPNGNLAGASLATEPPSGAQQRLGLAGRSRRRGGGSFVGPFQVRPAHFGFRSLVFRSRALCSRHLTRLRQTPPLFLPPSTECRPGSCRGQAPLLRGKGLGSSEARPAEGPKRR